MYSNKWLAVHSSLSPLVGFFMDDDMDEFYMPSFIHWELGLIFFKDDGMDEFYMPYFIHWDSRSLNKPLTC